MSEDARPLGGAGLYGKAPAHGDFLSHGLPRAFVGPWDGWLAGWLAGGRRWLGEAFEHRFMASPAWHFLLAPGLCGPQGWAGVMLPSVDKVGRCFPLTVALAVAGEDDMVRLLDEWPDGFGLMADAARDLAEGAAPFDAVLARLQELERSAPLPPPYCPPNRVLRVDGQARAWRVAIAEPVSAIVARDLLAAQFADAGCGHSLWWRAGRERPEASCILCRGLPAEAALPGFLDEAWSQAPWCAPAERGAP